MIDLIAVKDYIVDKAYDLSEALALEERAAACKKKFIAAKRDLKKSISALREKRLADYAAAFIPAKEEKRTNPFVAVFCVLGGILLAFAILVALFYGIFYLLDSKKKNGYHTLKF